MSNKATAIASLGDNYKKDAEAFIKETMTQYHVSGNRVLDAFLRAAACLFEYRDAELLEVILNGVDKKDQTHVKFLIRSVFPNLKAKTVNKALELVIPDDLTVNADAYDLIAEYQRDGASFRSIDMREALSGPKPEPTFDVDKRAKALVRSLIKYDVPPIKFLQAVKRELEAEGFRAG